MNRITRLCLSVAGVVLICLPARTLGEPSFAESIEWIIRDSAWILTGKVIAVDSVAENGRTFKTATVAVQQTIKGKHADRATFVLRPWLGSIASDWKREGIPLVFFLVKADCLKDRAGWVGLPKADWVLRDDHNNPSVVPLAKTTSGRQLSVFTRDYAHLTGSDAILKHLVAAAADAPQEVLPKPHEVRVPPDTPAFKELWGGGAIWLIVPVDRKLEELGRDLCALTGYFDRIEGAKILRYFKSDGNAEILKGFLNDPNYTVFVSGRVDEAGFHLTSHKKVYQLRQIAYDALKEFGAKVEAPVLEVPILEKPELRKSRTSKDKD